MSISICPPVGDPPLILADLLGSSVSNFGEQCLNEAIAWSAHCSSELLSCDIVQDHLQWRYVFFFVLLDFMDFNSRLALSPW